jgi:DNA-binding NarL/FixJ family response regulator
MPGGGGEKVLQHAIAQHPHIARIVLSGKGHTDSGKRAHELCHRFLNKPCPAKDLEAAIAWAIDRGQPAP